MWLNFLSVTLLIAVMPRRLAGRRPFAVVRLCKNAGVHLSNIRFPLILIHFA